MIDPGTYKAVAIAEDVQFGKAKSGTKQVAIPFRVTEGDFAGHVITYFGFFTDKTWKRTLEALRYCGWKGDDLSELGPLDQEVEIVVEHEEYDGKTRAKVAWVNRIGSGRVQLQDPMGDDELRQFAAQMRTRAQGVPEAEGPPANGSSGGGGHPFAPDSDFGGPAPEDDIPFIHCRIAACPHVPGWAACR